MVVILSQIVSVPENEANAQPRDRGIEMTLFANLDPTMLKDKRPLAFSVSCVPIYFFLKMAK